MYHTRIIASNTNHGNPETADFFPWTGGHPEDALSEALVKAGISNKPQIMNETNTARPSLWSNLKNKSGLSTLSTLFVAVLEKRQACGRLTTPNSFKPPPRLTLRDSTRETWLHDLANPTVGLRRLSRTIPHGITGKVLLDQCLNKNIPLPRAVWLAKCVGINEMRSHKRKGQAGTITWVRGWTSSVEQFLDSIIGTVGQPEWKPRITYALQLATSLYKEHLLEDEHFLDWILKCLDSSPPERLFLWLLIGSLYGQDLTASRRRGKRLAEYLLSHAEKV
jgi:mediator of RNA polymerase II transcription subunit 12